MINRVRQALLLVLALYILYLIKSAIGINLSQRYSAWKIFKVPIESFLHQSKT